ncbi:MAG: hypothetical protein A2V67_10935 [Deltaproteobacteria bacterium RBG_13_61_14]|nr:MAG: hypothetical protein A2V67_10935 [Deltaproteobacteria bacterium RBG_13_61_14]
MGWGSPAMNDVRLMGYFFRRLLFQKLLWAFLAVFAITTFFSIFSFAMTLFFTRDASAENREMILGFGLITTESAISFHGALLALVLAGFAAAALKSPDLEPILSKSTTREQLFGTAIFAHFIPVVVYWLCFYLFFIYYIRYFGLTISEVIIYGIFMRLVMFSILYFGAAFLGTSLSLGLAFALVFILIVYAQVAPMLLSFRSMDQIYQFWIKVVLFFIPDLSQLDLLMKSFRTNIESDWSAIAGSIIYGFLWCLALVMAALMVYRRKEFQAM